MIFLYKGYCITLLGVIFEPVVTFKLSSVYPLEAQAFGILQLNPNL